MWASTDARLEFEEKGERTLRTSSKTLNQATGKESSKAFVFSDINWSTSSQQYLNALNNFCCHGSNRFDMIKAYGRHILSYNFIH
jgi:hypothetical protein